MPTTELTHPEVPELITAWVRANPLPTLLLTDALVTLTANRAFTDLLNEQDWDTEAFLRGPLTATSPATGTPEDFLKNLEPGECVVKQIMVGKEHHYTFHLIKLELPAGSGSSCLCCMLMPSEDPSHARFTGILDDIACFVVEIDARGNVSYLNDRLLRHLGYAARDRGSLGHLRQLLRTFKEDQLHGWLPDGKPDGLAHFRTEFVTKDGTGCVMEVSLVASQPPDGSLFLLTARDLTIQLQHEEALHATAVQAERAAGDLRTQNAQLRVQLDRAAAGTGLVYRSKAFAGVMRQIQQVAPTGATALITGETGTGKELIARTIHRLSRRADEPFVTVDCGSLPPALIEGELFGYRKGAFTGATRDHPGRFAAADGGTIFLDEIGELPLPLQTRLLRVLQEGEYTPLGDHQLRTVDVRVIAATNRDLSQRVAEGEFRADLFYRLNVFPIVSIPLRERREDIQPLIAHFVTKFNAKFSREISGIDATTLARVAEYSFPGNVRELENLVERAFIASSGQLLPLVVPARREPASSAVAQPVLDVFDGTLTEFLSFEDYQRKYIQLVLDSTDGRVSGAGGAAEILKIHPQTLFSKLRKLGIRR